MAKVKAARSRLSAPLGGWRAAVTAFAFVAFALQSYIVQTHIHFSPDAELRLAGYVASHDTKPAQQAPRDKYPSNEDPANCPICQEILHSGHFVIPAAQVFLAPYLAVSTIVVVDTALPHIFALSHSWRGRAPPRS